ncbi:MAG: hypothetical protein WDM92_09745 [Caulobacteraceae bacterium]
MHVRGLQDVAYDDLPQIVVRTPMDAHVEAGPAVFGSIGRADSVELSNAGCGDWTVANVGGALKINTAGSGDTHAGDAGSLVVHVAGSGDVSARARGPRGHLRHRRLGRRHGRFGVRPRSAPRSPAPATCASPRARRRT